MAVLSPGNACKEALRYHIGHDSSGILCSHREIGSSPDLCGLQLFFVAYEFQIWPWAKWDEVGKENWRSRVADKRPTKSPTAM
ncbi:uncharacterized protein N7525_009908 [Penicillium rubens]|uniref:uncharacterized protein n=1 Tax=Penicillium rubens TaxID=1108849 RepID=UPI002382C145|nr:uncharacterized protein N7525_009908 [Penicillium rubens]KAJ5253597.1 hypothetical protein N7524_010777 [Penicillium chrysogenum]KAJ5831655.1 hypothetical protein N7525_009908 [Penicillium rubens]KAJ6141747.1 hypothetical protein N7497_010846 [Penicillium chrysogenum]